MVNFPKGILPRRQCREGHRQIDRQTTAAGGETLGAVDGQPVQELSETGLDRRHDVHGSIQTVFCQVWIMETSQQWNLLLPARHWIVIYSPDSQSRILGLGKAHEITGPGLSYVISPPFSVRSRIGRFFKSKGHCLSPPVPTLSSYNEREEKIPRTPVKSYVI